MNLSKQPTYALVNMIRALSLHSWRNTEEEQARLKAAKFEMKQRKSKARKGGRYAKAS